MRTADTRLDEYSILRSRRSSPPTAHQQINPSATAGRSQDPQPPSRPFSASTLPPGYEAKSILDLNASKSTDHQTFTTRPVRSPNPLSEMSHELDRAADSVVRALPRNSAQNLLALVLPMAVALGTTPYIVHRLGDERFGLFMVALSLVGFGGLLDFGLTSASVKFVAEYRAKGDDEALSAIINATLISRVPLAGILMTIGIFGAPLLVAGVMSVSQPLQAEAIFVVRVSAISVAVSMFSGTLAALPRGANRYDVTSRIGIATSLLLTGSTVGLLAVGKGLRAIVLAELALLIAQLFVYRHVARVLLPGWRFQATIQTKRLRQLLGFGGLVAVSGLTAIITIHLNRILVAKMLGVAAVTYFAVPWGLSARINQLVLTLTEAIAPAVTTLSATNSLDGIKSVCRQWCRLSVVVAAAIGVPLIVVAGEFLALWMGAPFAARSSDLLRLLCVAAIIQASAAIPYLALNGLGRPAAANLPAALGAVVNVLLMLVLAPTFGLVGIGLAFLPSVALQTALLYAGLGRALPETSLLTPHDGVALVAASASSAALALSLRLFLGAGLLRLIATVSLQAVAFQALLWMFFYDRADLEILCDAIFSILGRSSTRNVPPSERGRDD